MAVVQVVAPAAATVTAAVADMVMAVVEGMA